MNIESADRPSPSVIFDPPPTKLPAGSTKAPAVMRMLSQEKSADYSHGQHLSHDVSRTDDHQIPVAMRMLNQEKSTSHPIGEAVDNNHPAQGQHSPESAIRAIDNEKPLPSTHNDIRPASPSPSSEVNNDQTDSPVGLVYDTGQISQLSPMVDHTPERAAVTSSQTVAQHIVGQPPSEIAGIHRALSAEMTTAPHSSESEPLGIEQGESTHDSTTKNESNNSAALTAGKSETSDSATASSVSAETKSGEASLSGENSSDTCDNTNGAEKTANEADDGALTVSADERDELPASKSDPESSHPRQNEKLSLITVESENLPLSRPAPDTSVEFDDRLRKYLDQSEVTAAGRGFYGLHDTTMRQAAHHVSPTPGMYTVDIHGDTAGVYIEQQLLSPDDLGTILKLDPNWNGQPVRLFACKTGRDYNGFAQLFADCLNVGVTAPTELVWSEPDGTTYVTSKAGVDIDGDPIPTVPHDGEWRTFHPRITSRREV